MDKLIMPVAKITVPVDLERIKDELEKEDIVSVIRCKDCKYYKENTLVCGRYGLEDDDYCSWAERKES